MARNLTDCCSEVTSIPDVVKVLGAIRDASAEDILAPKVDGISCFSRLYTIITQNVLDTVEGNKQERTFQDPAFLTELDLQFARRYLAAIRAYEAGERSTPRAWSVLFDRRRDQDIHHVNFAAAGVNAHVNYDLTFALLETWKKYPPTAARRSDYDQVNDIFAEEMDQLREDFGAFLAETRDGGLLDRFGNSASDLVVRLTRGLAWDAAHDVWQHYDSTQDGGGQKYQDSWADADRRLDRSAQLLGWMILKSPDLP
ncbi:DUF5995 family protein [Pseudonocardia sp. RS11V-5]|uniref:DUF5995 family protein n=1 Tax=Pseudonocardia terrae TaxID=2905831 RepID=UPI001E45E0AC|nr:DUF5995 family protein [Pseudonocardia terrae]MCE3549938.1 DUF5995 family protein [Pseudonocardia terrae]